MKGMLMLQCRSSLCENSKVLACSALLMHAHTIMVFDN